MKMRRILQRLPQVQIHCIKGLLGSFQSTTSM
ncbi:BnaC04g54840D [Brassica napus]|uniref:BnaC04g54840D protein n=1 Tax=Brassica napus TaxID=3708 RepID=A0A078J091_BRANA|nr:BnaC04g54840D [Brassica napus]